MIRTSVSRSFILSLIHICNGQAETADKLARAMEALADKLREEPKPEDTHE